MQHQEEEKDRENLAGVDLEVSLDAIISPHPNYIVSRK